MKTHEKIIILSIIIVFGSSGFLLGFWAGGGFYNPKSIDIERREQTLQSGLEKIESNNTGFENQLEFEQRDRDEFKRIIEKEGLVNSEYESSIEELQGLSISIENRKEKIDIGFEKLIEEIRKLEN